MNYKENFLSIVGTVGGSGAIIVGLSVWLGNISASHIESSTKAKYDTEIKLLESKLELSRTQKIRNAEAQFGLYKEVWTNLMDLKSSGDRLWVNVTKENLEDFTMLLEKTRQAVNRGRLILKEDHYQQLQGVFQALENYRFGKGDLVNLRQPGAVGNLYNNYSHDDIVNRVKENEKHKKEYEVLTLDILSEFRKQLGLSG